MSRSEDYIEKSAEIITQIQEKARSLSEEAIRRNPAESEWSVMQIVCHVNEFVPYFLGDLKQVVDAGGGVEWGRGLTHESRLSAVNSTEQQSTAAAVDKLDETKTLIKNTLAPIEDNDWDMEAPHRNPKFGVKPISFLVEHFIVEHLEKHLQQVERNISKLQ